MMQRTREDRLLDEYGRNARLRPALVTILPISLMISAQGLHFSVVVALVVGPLSAIGFSFVLAEFARDSGKAHQPYLFNLWHGKPSTAKLRHRDASVNPHTRARYHQFAAQLLGRALPSQEEESADPEGADLVYESVVDLLRERTRDRSKYPLIFRELVSYGFRRNLWGMKPFGISLALSCVMLQSWILTRELKVEHSMQPAQFLATLINVSLVLCWTFLVKPEWVRRAADAYAERLLAACLV
jgi:hypothetical protein